MDDVLLDLIIHRLGEHDLPDPAADLLLAACDGEAPLARALGGASTPRPKPSGTSSGRKEPAGAYLRSITVAGFRGVGPECELPLDPGPGLTLVVGRNGSGKSSFAEGLEVLLTGGLRRWEERSAIWGDSWRNLHCPDSPKLEAQLLLEDGGPTTVRRTWEAEGGIKESEATMQVKSQKRQPLSELGWSDDLAAYRPFLSHSELEAFFGRPTDLYELLSSVLGLEDLTDTAGRLAEARKQREGALAQAKKSLPALLTRLESVDDERARQCIAALSGRKWDLDTVETTVTGTAPSSAGGELEWLRRAAQLTGPDATQVEQIAAGLRDAATVLEDTAGSESGLARELADLLDAALSHVSHVDTNDCPVCGTAAALGGDWRKKAAAQVAQLRSKAKAADDAARAASLAVRTAQSVLTTPPAFLKSAVPEGFDVSDAVDSWTRWSTRPDSEGSAGLNALADHLSALAPEVDERINLLATQARQALQEREDRWSPVAAELAGWTAAARAGQAAAEVVPHIKAAEKWLKEANDDIRNSRLEPIAEQARAIWAQLRQESNVDLGAIRLAGSGPKRQLQIDVTVDGSRSAALGVMSQGEVNALALSIFLPRATLPESPFRFLSIDDPVQAMDPAKVDGFARVLEDVSKRRQVVVFTHDDRLHEAIRRLKIAAIALEVTRQAESFVEVRQVDDPADRAISDAFALCADDSVPHKVAARVVPGLCRIAVESAFTAAVRRQQLAKGKRHADVEAQLEDAAGTNELAALAIFGDASNGGQVLPRLNKWDRRVADTYQAVRAGAHMEHPGELRDLVRNTESFVHEIRTNLP